ncbi:MAG: TlpA family protein disulfide reductase [Elusimicrobiales bacterium]|nr:TlpA family protein disulfide reductase [Elusimicrobiales bacterium]MCK5584195.1 TlpA family protein disulfide reductase [Elusimicrobiales bacterium]
MKTLKQTNLLILAAIMCAAIACAKENKETGNSKKEIQVSTQKGKKMSETTPAYKRKIIKTGKIKTPYQKKETYFSLPNRNGGTIDLANYADKPVILIFFAEYCHYCKKAAPFMKEIYDTYMDKGLIILGVSVDANKDSANKFANERNLNFPIAYDGATISRQYKTRGVPYIFIFNNKHEIMDFWAGYDKSFDAEIIETIAEVLK